MTASDAERRLDGNAAAGLLAQTFCIEMTTATVICAGCGATGPMAELLLYGLEMGVVLRCAHCDTVVARAATTNGRVWVDLRGAASLRIERPAG
jgi:hypothetical protein